MFRTFALFVSVLGLFFCQPQEIRAQIANSKHDLSFGSSASIRTSSNTYKESCIFCHTPHTPLASPEMLWNRNASGAVYTVYASSTIEAPIPQPGIASKNCLSCHDGTIAYASLINTNNGGSALFSGTGQMDTSSTLVTSGLGTDLSNDHPIGFVYNAHQSTDAELRPATVMGKRVVVFASGPNRALPLSGSSIGSATMECTTCHDPHGVPGVPQFLRTSNQRSQLCFTCHLK